MTFAVVCPQSWAAIVGSKFDFDDSLTGIAPAETVTAAESPAFGSDSRTSAAEMN
jgi:hypothetical protein